MRNSPRVIIACPTKFHSFALAEQLDKHGCLVTFYTIYHSEKNRFISHLNKRKDSELIDLKKIKTFPYLAPLYRIIPNDYIKNKIFDFMVSFSLRKRDDYDIFIGWSGMSIRSIKTAKIHHKKTILERGSSHIEFQKEILTKEYSLRRLPFKMNKKTVNQELAEYSLVDYISIPSKFVRDSFIVKGYSQSKLLLNNYGASQYFKPIEDIDKYSYPFRILYLGTLSVRKGAFYLLEALKLLDFEHEVWFIGKIDADMKRKFESECKDNWKYFGFIPQEKLASYINQCHIAIQPSLEEGLSMVIPQIMSCGVPVIATKSSGGEDIIVNNETGILIRSCDSEALYNSIKKLYKEKDLYNNIKKQLKTDKVSKLTWNNYGLRYIDNIKKITQ